MSHSPVVLSASVHARGRFGSVALFDSAGGSGLFFFSRRRCAEIFARTFPFNSVVDLFNIYFNTEPQDNRRCAVVSPLCSMVKARAGAGKPQPARDVQSVSCVCGSHARRSQALATPLASAARKASLFSSVGLAICWLAD